MATPPDKVIAFIADGEDSFMAYHFDGTWYPAVSSGRNAGALALMEDMMRDVAKQLNITIRKYEFTERREIGVITGTKQ